MPGHGQVSSLTSDYDMPLIAFPLCGRGNLVVKILLSCVFDNVEQKVCYFRVVSARKTTVRLLNVPRQTVSDEICRFKDLGNVVDVQEVGEIVL
ncbi:hypothetical protein TNCV_359301 [Trichonephila clavipes]|nr:hypothetical protein TNCV_359301 [Trichonephila clavipes]